MYMTTEGMTDAGITTTTSELSIEQMQQQSMGAMNVQMGGGMRGPTSNGGTRPAGFGG
jgi:hypothetical protein